MKRKSVRTIRQPRLILGGVYSTQDLIENLMISDKTLSAWVRDGLRPLTPETKSQYFLADDLVDFWKEQNRRQCK